MRIKKEYAGKDGWSRWVQPVRKGYRMQCCDCGLVHIVDYRVVKGRAQFRMKRSTRAKRYGISKKEYDYYMSLPDKPKSL